MTFNKKLQKRDKKPKCKIFEMQYMQIPNF